MGSKMLIGSKPLSLTIGPGGLRFSRKADKRNNCIGDVMRGKTGTPSQIKSAFTSAAKSCSGAGREKTDE